MKTRNLSINLLILALIIGSAMNFNLYGWPDSSYLYDRNLYGTLRGTASNLTQTRSKESGHQSAYLRHYCWVMSKSALFKHQNIADMLYSY